jgi:hypothetical protein
VQAFGDPGAVDDGGAGPGIQIEHQPVWGVSRAVGADCPLWYV